VERQRHSGRPTGRAPARAAFTEADLQRFLAPASPAALARQTGVQSEVFIGGTLVPLHRHLATFYNSDEGRLRVPIPFLREGLLRGQRCFLAASGHAVEAYLTALNKEDGLDIDAAIRGGQFVAIDGPGATVEAALSFWEHALSNALAVGPTLQRVVGEMASERTRFS
jgi:CO dehydrogenase/acetyl-CoA synthase gamma subunit (corrinoid Fe-S protein)